ncbi:MAG: hypothetical protein JWL60_2655 [Gemmatimonadetes bacterium]|nr:hypothetical protein [Gemmatimonadota bacterium]
MTTDPIDSAGPREVLPAHRRAIVARLARGHAAHH